IGHKIQYPIQTSSSASDEPNEGGGEQDSNNEFEGDCTSTSGCSTNFTTQARDDWTHSEESSGEEDEYGTLSEIEHSEDELEAGSEDSSNSTSDDEDIRF
ncbi:hypothetical protein SCLCIDRAFT_34656, partial [Scleroderma citrinum Foug A]